MTVEIERVRLSECVRRRPAFDQLSGRGRSRRGVQDHQPGTPAGADRAGPARTRGAHLRTGAQGAARPPISHAPRVHPRGTRHHVGTTVGPGRREPDQSGRRRTPSAAPTRVRGVHPAGGRTAAHRHRRRHQRTGRPAHGDRHLRHRRRRRDASTRSRSSARCSVHPARTGNCSPSGPTTSSRASSGTPPTTHPSCCAPGMRWTPTSTTWSLIDATH